MEQSRVTGIEVTPRIRIKKLILQKNQKRRAVTIIMFILTHETLKTEPRSPSIPVVDLSGYVCSYMPDEANSSSPSNNQTAIKENGTTTTELRRSKRIHGAPTS